MIVTPLDPKPKPKAKASLSLAGSAPRDLESLVTEACEELLGSLRRTDQRRRGAQYIRGLLTASGRKTARNIATFVGAGASAQSLHHFVAGSTWDWRPVRAALARYVDDGLRPDAWVIRPMVVSKTGVRSVGVRRRFVPDLGRVMSCQRSHGLWLASDAMAAPVSWHLTLDGGPGGEADRQPGAAGEERDLARLVAEIAQANRTVARPVVMDARSAAVPPLVRALTTAGLPFMLRVGGELPLAPAAGRVQVDRRPQTAPAQHLMEQLKRLGRPVECHGAVNFVTPLAVVLPGMLPQRTLLLMGVWRANRRRPADLWLTDLTSWGHSALLRLAMLTERVDADFAGVSVDVGVRDFEGRSFQGWHRHVTLASIAHALRLSQGGQWCGYQAPIAV
ncbi:IS701 family transposase [Streptomyces sp. URMC 123]|uniref:IS701 family transposase n=1 Tax=Streptomyces sp. URMC 123 TaxID=3423403 RepID=UPI003F1A5876